jgi:hypothetical protein
LEKLIQEQRGTGCSKTFIHDGKICQLTTMNEKVKWKRLKNVEESQLRGVTGDDYISMFLLEKVQLYVNFSNSIHTLPKSHMHIFNVSITSVQGLKNVRQTVITQSRCHLCRTCWKNDQVQLHVIF